MYFPTTKSKNQTKFTFIKSSTNVASRGISVSSSQVSSFLCTKQLEYIVNAYFYSPSNRRTITSISASSLLSSSVLCSKDITITKNMITCILTRSPPCYNQGGQHVI